MPETSLLPIKARIDFKILLLTWKALHGMAPRYLSDLLKENECNRPLRSANNYKLSIPKTNNVTCGDKAFAKATCVMEFSTIQSVDKIYTFTNKLTIYLFNCCYTNILVSQCIHVCTYILTRSKLASLCCEALIIRFSLLNISWRLLSLMDINWTLVGGFGHLWISMNISWRPRGG